MLFTRVQAEEVVGILRMIFNQNDRPDKAIQSTFKERKEWPDKVRRNVVKAVYDIVSKARYYQYLGDIDRFDGWILLAMYLWLRTENIPKWKSIPNYNLSDLEDRKQNPKIPNAILHSLPDWLDALGEQELGEEWPEIMARLNEPSDQVIRVNRLKTHLGALRKQFEVDGVQTVQLGTSGLIIEPSLNVFSKPAFKEGLFEVQDGASQEVAPFLEVSSGMTVIDACAGAGGKTLHLADLMKNKGRLIALDTVGWKLKNLKTRARRAGVSNLDIREITTTKIVKRLYGKADRVLLDVPCSGLGVLKRNPDIKWTLTETQLDEVRKIQADLLKRYSNLCKVGGELVYATCSILPSENEQQVASFLAAHKDQFELRDAQNIRPSKGYDGFYMAKLKRLS